MTRVRRDRQPAEQSISVQDIINAARSNWVQGDTVLGDVLIGTDLNETFDGCGGIDAIYGGAGDDVIIGGEEADYLSGGPGRDVFQFARDTRYGDHIEQFVKGEDIIQFCTDWIDMTWADVNIRQRGDHAVITVDDTNIRIIIDDVIGQGRLDASDFYLG